MEERSTEEGGKEKDEGARTQESQEEVCVTEELRRVISTRRNNKAPGEDGIPNEAWKWGGENTWKALGRVIRNIEKKGDFPKEWKTGLIAPIYKKGDKKDVKNYRGITLMDSGYKIYAEWLRWRLEGEVERKGCMSDTQMGFRRERGMRDAIYCLNSMVKEGIKAERGIVFLLFVDLKAAFDKLDREVLWKSMEKMNLNEDLVRRIKGIYEETYCKIRVGDSVSKLINIKKGVRQGCPLSPLLFNLALADLEEYMSVVQEGGIVMVERKYGQ